MRRQYTRRRVIPSVETLTFDMDEVKKELCRVTYGRYPTPKELDNIELEVQEARTSPPHFGRRLTLRVMEILT